LAVGPNAKTPIFNHDMEPLHSNPSLLNLSSSSILLLCLTQPCYNCDNSLTYIETYIIAMDNITFKMVTNDEELRSALEVRRQVFVQEQGVSEGLEYDGYDDEALHMVVKDEERVIGTARVRFLTTSQAKIERIAVLMPFRRRGIGRNIISFLKRELKNKQIEHVVLHAQYAVTAFYKSCGFVEIGPPFWEDGIKHIKMQLRL